ncbi:MAG TPA: hypothetical protein VNJ29_03985 [Candidatus Nitrosotenuis sp.]|jgi:hypothetical protein|nr:hypothetical protein [Candidatus Nitrosotenuis sp.]
MSTYKSLSLMALLFNFVTIPVKASDEKSCPQFFPGAKETGTVHEKVVGMVMNAGILHQRKFTIMNKIEAQEILDKHKGKLFDFRTVYFPKCGFEFSIKNSKDRIIGYFED